METKAMPTSDRTIPRWQTCLITAAIIGGGVFPIAADEPASAAIGVARIDITPDYPVRLNGFGFRRAESEGVRQRIWAKALAIGDDKTEGGPAVLIAMDTLATPDWLVLEISKRLAKCGIQRQRLAITATHTHSAPMINGVSPTIFSEPIPSDHQAHIDQYSKDVTDKLEQVVLAALKDRKPGTLEYGLGTVKFAKNRRKADGPVDHDLPLLAVKDSDGKLRAVYVSYACHCVTLSDNQINGDWAGYASEEIDRRHPGCTALVSIGCGADANPSSGVTGSKADVAQSQGVEIATEVSRLLSGPLTSLLSPHAGTERHGPGVPGAPRSLQRSVINAKIDTIHLPLAALPTREQWEARAKEKGAVGHHARTQLAKLDAGQQLATSIRYPIQTWTFGDSLAMVFLPGEVVVDYSQRLKRELDGHRLWINAYANGAPGYIPSERILREGGYEGGGAMVYYGIPGPYAAGLEQKIVDVALAQLGKNFAPPVAPKKTQGSLPRTPRQSLALLRTKPGFVAELVACEPLIASPVAVDFGPDGKLWVAEMYDYPSGVSNDYQPGGRVRLVEDSNGDGQFDKSTVFLEGIPFPTGVTVWRGGVLICAAPDILFAEDKNGDGHADELKKLFSGFGTENYQGRVNSLRYGLDGWVYGSCGLFGGQIRSFNGTTLALGNRDFRIKPDTGEIEAVTGTTHQGRVRNDWGDWFGCDNSTLIRHYPVVDHYVRRNSHVAPPATLVPVASGPDPGRLYPISQTTLFPLSGQPNRVTAACGLEIYRDDLLGAEYRGDSFTCEPVSNLVHHLDIQAKGVTFTGQRPEDETDREFLASSDPWFRPVQALTGPDGALWVVDMYRYVIEHPRWIPPDTVAKLDVRAGHNLGRIFRILPVARQTEVPDAADPKARLANSPVPPRMDKLDTAGLVAALDSPNGWQRDMAQQLLHWRGDKSAAPALERLAAKTIRPEAALQAVCTIDVLGGLELATVAHALGHSHAGVRRHGVRLAEGFLGKDALFDVGLLAFTEFDNDPQVQLQLCYSLGQWQDPRAADGLANLLLRHHSDAYLRTAALSSLSAQNVEHVLWSVLDADDSPQRKAVLTTLLSLAVAIGDEQTLVLAIELALAPVDGPATAPQFAAEQFSACAGILDALRRRQFGVEKLPADSQNSIRRLLAGARDVAADIKAQDADRIAATLVLGRLTTERTGDLAVLSDLLLPQVSPAVQSAAVEAIGRTNADHASQLLFAGWASHTPRLRGQVLEVVMGRPSGIETLLQRLESRRVLPGDIDAARRQRLLQLADAELRARAEKIFSTAGSADRQKVLTEHQDVLTMSGDRASGKAVFAKRCAACHQLEGTGHVVGQNLAALTNRSPQALLIAVLDPNRQLDERYITYAAITQDGRTFSGILAGESGTSITLKGQEGKEQVLLRAEIDQLQSTGKSLMPEGLERDVSKQELADLFAYLAQIGPTYKQFDGNTPVVVRPEKDGTLALLATACEIYGGEIAFEAPFRNIGYWHGEQDHVVWTVQTQKAGEYDVWLDFACHPDSAGNAFVLEGAAESLRGKIESTGGWDQYRQQKIGSAKLAEGTARWTLRPDGQLARHALVDLRAVVFSPLGTKPKSAWVNAAAAIANAPAVDPRRSTPADYAKRILDSAVPDAERAAIVQSQPHLAAEIIAAMASDLSYGTEASSKEEYRRIPWIWRVAVAAGKRNNATQIKRILEVSMPAEEQPLRDWQAVVIGGGIVNGLSQAGAWPRERVAELSEDDEPLSQRWRRVLDLASSIADNESVASGTRYDALRILGADAWESRAEQLKKFLAKGTQDELQMGAISALGDMQHADVGVALLASFPHYSKQNRDLVCELLFRDEARVTALLDALEKAELTAAQLGDDRCQKLLMLPDPAMRQRARKLLEK